MPLNQSEFQRLVTGQVDLISPGLAFEPSKQRRVALFPGSFNPLHKGHLRIAKIAREQFDLDVWYELSVVNVEKKALTWTELEARMSQNFCAQTSPVMLTHAATFEEKLTLFPEAVFVVGVDTLVRIDDFRFYRDSKHREQVLDQFQTRPDGYRFLVFGRWQSDEFLLEQVKIDDRLRQSCQFVPQSKFDVRISSSEIRTS